MLGPEPESKTVSIPSYSSVLPHRSTMLICTLFSGFNNVIALRSLRTFLTRAERDQTVNSFSFVAIRHIKMTGQPSLYGPLMTHLYLWLRDSFLEV